MKESLATGLETIRRVTVDKASTIGFMGEDLRVYATPALVRDVEVTCREFLLGHLDEGEDSVGTRVEIDHLAPTLLGMWAEIKVSVSEVAGRLITFEFTAEAALETIARGRHQRFVVDKAKTADRLASKAAKAARAS